MSVMAPLTPDGITPGGVFIPQPQTWVQLRQPLSRFSHDQALLLCPESHGQWIAWIPDHGSAVLDRGQFYKLDTPNSSPYRHQSYTPAQ